MSHNFSNIYAARVFAEHPLALWSLDDEIYYVSTLNENYKDVEIKSIQQMWLEDLEKLEKIYDKYINIRIDKYKQSIFNDQVKVKKSKK